jgi:hypothetical protein
MFRKWYAHENPKPKDSEWIILFHSSCTDPAKTVSYKEFGKHMTKIYKDTILSIEDPEERAEALRPIWDFVDNLDAMEDTSEHALKSVVSTMQSAKDQFTTLVGQPSTYCLLTYYADTSYRPPLSIT